MALEPYRTNYTREYTWPGPLPACGRPVPPPKTVKPAGYYMYRPTEISCPCSWHEWQPLEARYRCLARKECNMLADLCGLRNEMTYLSNKMMEQPCVGDDDKLRSLSMATYVHDALPQVSHKQLREAMDSDVGVPIPPQRRGFGSSKYDPFSFRQVPHIRPRVDPPQPLSLCRTPASIDVWWTCWPGKSEYEDTVSRMGTTVMRCLQQYREPNPSSRCRFGDPHV